MNDKLIQLLQTYLDKYEALASDDRDLCRSILLKMTTPVMVQQFERGGISPNLIQPTWTPKPPASDYR